MSNHNITFSSVPMIKFSYNKHNPDTLIVSAFCIRSCIQTFIAFLFNALCYKFCHLSPYWVKLMDTSSFLMPGCPSAQLHWGSTFQQICSSIRGLGLSWNLVTGAERLCKIRSKRSILETTLLNGSDSFIRDDKLDLGLASKSMTSIFITDNKHQTSTALPYW